MLTRSDGRPHAGSWVLRGPQTVIPHQWLTSQDVLIRFDNPPEELDFLLSTECLLNTGPIWVFKLNDDGVGHLIQSRAVRPGNRHVLLTSDENIELAPWITKSNVDCLGIKAIGLDVPEVVLAELNERLEPLGINQVRTLEVRPAGLPAANWDGEGNGEWLSSDTPRLGIRIGYTVDSASVVLADRQEGPLNITWPVTGEPFFLELPTLAVGWYRLIVTTRRGPDGESAHLDIVIREPLDWSSNWATRGLLNYSIDPRNPSLEDVWEGRVTLEIEGPSHQTVGWDFVLFDRGGKELAHVRGWTPCISLSTGQRSVTNFNQLSSRHVRYERIKTSHTPVNQF